MIGYTRAQLFRESVHKGSFPLVPNEADRSSMTNSVVKLHGSLNIHPNKVETFFILLYGGFG